MTGKGSDRLPSDIVPGTTGARPARSGEFEFDGAHNAVIRDLAGSMKIVGAGLPVFAVFTAIGAIRAVVREGPIMALAPAAQAVFLVLTGMWTYSAAGAFQRVVATRGDDIRNLMSALAELRRIYTMQKWLILVVAALLVVSIVMMILR